MCNMICPRCQSVVSTILSNAEYCQCSSCHTVFHVCGPEDDHHSSNCNVLYCPVCGKTSESSVDAERSKFLPIAQNSAQTTKHWSEPQKLGFRKCSHVFHVLFDSFLIFISNGGEYVVYDGNNLIEKHSLKLKEKETILILRYSLKRIVFLTSDQTLYQVGINTLLQQSSTEKISENVHTFTVDSPKDCIAYVKKSEIIIIGIDGTTEKIKESGQIVYIVLNSEHLFYVKKEATLFTYVVRLLHTSKFSQKTVTLTDNPDKILASANNKFLAVALCKGNRVLITAGKWKNLTTNAANWDEITIQGSLTSITAGNDDLVFIQYSDRIELKDMNNLKSGTLNQAREVPDMISQILSLSLDGNFVSLCRRDTADTSYDASQVFLLSKSLREEYIGSEKARFIIDSYSWLNGLLAAVINKNGEYLFSLEMANDE